MANISDANPGDRLAEIFRQLGQPDRLQILLAIGKGEACVCHLEAALGLRQAAISQHLMSLRDSGLVSTRREGRHIYYSLSQPGLLEMIYQAASLVGATRADLEVLALRPQPGCPCPFCQPSQE
ncbi:MAG TPA: metalloregulator ArsR/SmtB family transcription factor [Anaerolineaceae bacterium]